MATFLDLSLFQYFNIIFPVLLIFAVVFALLQKTQALGKNVGINATVAIAIALMSMLSKTVIDLINFISPWFVLAFIFLVLLLMLYQTMGATEKDIFSALKGEKTIQWAVIGVAVTILIAGFGHVLGQSLLSQQPGKSTSTSTTGVNATSGASTVDWQKNIESTLFNSKILGLILIFLIAIFTVAFLSSG